ncbi:MAG TPA: Vms1/Ankzf1 family peptidyl-tRNA hydrolase [Gaiellaceae bacterium]|jgi:peptide chain release factor subunit 1|nr:Vms1/Ankzf1 family peptidyl-tRNA hydrolase [Gaiellaceae bacterium]
MAATITWGRLRELAAFRAAAGCAISLYVDLDPSIAPTAGDVDSRFNALVNEAEKTAGRDAVSHDAREALKADLARIRRFFDSEFDRDGVHGLALFAAGGDNLWVTLPLSERVPDAIKIRRDLHLSPLVPLVGRSDGAVVAVVGREQGHLYRLRDGRLEEVVDRSEEQPGRHDQGGWSQARYQRHIENLVQEHFKDVAEALDQQLRRARGPRVVLVASEEARSEFMNSLSNEAKAAVVGATQAEAHATPAELLEIVKPHLVQARLADERSVLDRWQEEAGRNGRAASGWEQTLEAASDGRVEMLLFSEGVEREAWQCAACGRGSAVGGSCPLDGETLERVDEGLEVAVHRTLAHGGTVLAVEANRDLDPVEGIGALLRY